MAFRSTILIPNYNGIQYLEACLQSILDCGDEAQILVVDNASADGSERIIRDFSEKYDFIHGIYLPENTGFCGAVNRGIEAVLQAEEEYLETEFVLLLNNDVTVAEGFVRTLEQAMDRDARIFSAGSQMRMMKNPEYIDNAGDYYCALGWAFDYGKGHLAAPRYEKPRRVFAACGGAAMYRCGILREIGLFDPLHFAYLEDVDIGYRARIFGYHNVYEPGSLVFHAGSSVSGSKYNEFKTNLSSRNSIYLIIKNMPMLQILLNLPFLLPGFGVKWLFFCRKKMGRLYLKGLGRGFAMAFSKEGRKHKVSFRFQNLPHYCRIQLELWENIVRRFFG